MRKQLMFCLVAVFAVCLMSLPAFAEDGGTSRGVYQTSIDPLTEWLNSTEDFEHNHSFSYEKKTFDKLIGADIKLIDLKKLLKQNVLDSINTEYRFSLESKSHTVAAVISIDLSALWQK